MMAKDDRSTNVPVHAEPEEAWRSVPQYHKQHPFEYQADDQPVKE